MEITYTAWALSALAMAALAVVLGKRTHRQWWGIVVDNRGRCSLTQFQIVVWSVVVLSLIGGVFVSRLIDGVEDPLGFTIPGEVLALLGISLGSTVLSGAIKSSKDVTNKDGVAATLPDMDDPATGTRLSQMFLVEEGDQADKVVDVTKYQNFWLTLILMAAYVAIAIRAIADTPSPAELMELPGIDGTLITLLGISHGGYLAGKMPPKSGLVTPEGARGSLRMRQEAIERSAATARNVVAAPRNHHSSS